jgi:NodT family efflux transporter outer membrane factor (OMF) lipoprotein
MRMNKKSIQLLPVFSVLLLSACVTESLSFDPPQKPQRWLAATDTSIGTTNAENLNEWWRKFNDISLNKLIVATMKSSPDRNAAEARILEARGNRRSVRGNLFPQLDASAHAGRQDTGTKSGNFYDAGFDASYEIDIFGGNRSRTGAANSLVESAEASYEDVTLTLVAETARNYIEYRGFRKQAQIAKKNLEAQEKTLELVQQLKDLGESPQLDVERAENLVSTTRAGIAAYERQADAARLRLTVLTGLLPEDIVPILAEDAPIPGADIQPVLAAPADVLTKRPDIRAAAANLSAQTDLSDAAVSDLFPTFNLAGFFGVQKTALIDPTHLWSVAVGAAVNLLDFGRIEGQIDASHARETQAYEALRKAVLQAVTDVETSLSGYAHINDQRIALERAQANAQKSLALSQDLYKEGEISFLDILDAQRTVNSADSALVNAEAAQALELVALYKALGTL